MNGTVVCLFFTDSLQLCLQRARICRFTPCPQETCPFKFSQFGAGKLNHRKKQCFIDSLRKVLPLIIPKMRVIDLPEQIGCERGKRKPEIFSLPNRSILLLNDRWHFLHGLIVIVIVVGIKQLSSRFFLHLAQEF